MAIRQRAMPGSAKYKPATNLGAVMKIINMVLIVCAVTMAFALIVHVVAAVLGLDESAASIAKKSILAIAIAISVIWGSKQAT